MKYAIALVMLASSLTACSTAPSDGLTQPDVQQYTKREQKQAAKELETYGPHMPVVAGKILPDCLMMRDQARANSR